MFEVEKQLIYNDDDNTSIFLIGNDIIAIHRKLNFTDSIDFRESKNFSFIKNVPTKLLELNSFVETKTYLIFNCY